MHLGPRHYTKPRKKIAILTNIVKRIVPELLMNETN